MSEGVGGLGHLGNPVCAAHGLSAIARSSLEKVTLPRQKC